MRKITILLITAALLAIGVSSAFAQQPTCVATEQSTEEVLPGVYVTWDSAFLCANAPDEGAYAFTVTVANDSSSVETVTVNAIKLTHTTPRPRGQAPQATADVSGLPITLAPGESQEFSVSGTYTLVWTEGSKKANLHFRASGYGETTGVPFHLGVNVLLRGEGAVDPDDDEPQGPPPWVPGPPPWAGNDDDDDDEGVPPGVPGLPSWAPGPPPWAGDDDDADQGPPPDLPGPPSWAGDDDDADHGPPPDLPGPPPWASDDNKEDDKGPPAWVPEPPPGGGPPGDRGR